MPKPQLPTTPPSQGPRPQPPEGSRSVRSPWAWRGLFFMSLVALGIFISCLSAHNATYAGLWAVITVAWFGFSMWLWRKHVVYENAFYGSQKPRRARATR